MVFAQKKLITLDSLYNISYDRSLLRGPNIWQILWLYQRFVLRYDRDPSVNNHQFVYKAVPHLYEITTESRILALIQVHRGKPHLGHADPIVSETVSELTSVIGSYDYSLSDVERQFYWQLTARDKVAFRICRRLALGSRTRKGDGRFYLSCRNLGNRLGVSDMTAFRILRKFQKEGLIAVVQKGRVWKKGHKDVATVYEWLPDEPKCSPYKIHRNGSQSSGNGSKTRFEQEDGSMERKEAYEERYLRVKGTLPPGWDAGYKRMLKDERQSRERE